MSASPLPTLFLTEGILKVLGGSIFFFSPSSILKNLAVAPYPASSLSVIQSLGTQTLAFSIPLFLASRNDPASVKSRKIVYWALLGREGLLGLGLVAQLLWGCLKGGVGRPEEEDARSLEEGLGKGGAEARAEEARMLRNGLCLWIAELVPFVLGRVWILSVKGEWFD